MLLTMKYGLREMGVAEHSVAALIEQSDYWLNAQGV